MTIRRPAATVAALLAFGSISPLGPSLAMAGSGPIPFTEEAVARGVDFSVRQYFNYGFAVTFADLDNDGDPDLVALGRENGHIGLYENDGTGHFVDRFDGSGIPAVVDSSGVVAGDYDSDGDLDLYLANWGAAGQASLLLRNNGNFSFTDESALSGTNAIGPGSGCAWSDYDGDGRIDLLSAMRYQSDGTTTPTQLFRNLGGGKFLNTAPSVGLPATNKVFQVVFLDYDDDGDADLFFSNDKCPTSGITNKLYRNDGGTFVDVTASTHTGVCLESMGVAVGDFDGNGHSDLYATNTYAGNALLLNNGAGAFTESSVPCGVASFVVGWGATIFDYDNDGFQELYVCDMEVENRLYDHDGVWPAQEIGVAAGVNDPGTSFCDAVADIDLDGDLDLAVCDSPGRVLLYINHEGETRDWVKFRVVGDGLNTFAIGAKVEILAGPKSQMREVHAGGNGFKGQNELTLHFGLGTQKVVDEVLVRWPGGGMRALHNLNANSTWTLYPDAALGDANGDDVVNLADYYAILDCRAAVGDLLPGCEMMDFNGDGAVDATDLAAFALRFVGTSGDCDSDGASDIAEILSGAESDVNRNTIPDSCESVGDCNCSGAADMLDISAFVLAIIDPSGYADQFPECNRLNADTNGDGAVNVLDINRMIELLVGS
ncbi:ASPIC and UnbV [Phycisphaerae bacterium RAS1]|nr:ASPIC and UnbV [Phycisphaerae bacterium RAS1]